MAPSKDDDNPLHIRRSAEEDKKVAAVKIQCEILKCDEPMPSGNIYPREEVEKAVNELAPHCKSSSVLGAYNPNPDQLVVGLDKVTHKVTGISLNDDGIVEAELQLMPTTEGHKLYGRLKEGYPVRMAPRGFGEKSEDGTIKDYRIVTVDIFPDPGPEGSDDEAA